MAIPSPNILVVEDDRETRTLIAKYLRNNSCNVTAVGDGREMSRAMADHRVDLIILDVMLPDINGKEVCQRVRADNTLEDVRIICISGMIEEDKIQELKLAGADDFLHTPFDYEELIDRMCAQLEIEPAPTTA